MEYLLGKEAIGVLLCGVCLLLILQKGHVFLIWCQDISGAGWEWKGDGGTDGAGLSHKKGCVRWSYTEGLSTNGGFMTRKHLLN